MVLAAWLMVGIKLDILNGPVYVTEYICILQTCVVPSAQLLFSISSVSRMTVSMSSYQTGTNWKCQDAVQSLDLNSIENLCLMVVLEVVKRHPTTKHEL